MAKLEIIYHDNIGKVLHVRVAKAPPKLKQLELLIPKGCRVVGVRATTDFTVWLVEYESAFTVGPTKQFVIEQFEALLADEKAFAYANRQPPIEAFMHASVGIALVCLAVWILNH